MNEVQNITDQIGSNCGYAILRNFRFQKIKDSPNPL
jgi:hypothetical protein